MSERRAFSWRDDPAIPQFPDAAPLFVFDGDCVLCSGAARFVLRHDRRRRFRLTTAQGPLGVALYRHFDMESGEEGTMLVIRDGRLLTRSDGIIAMADELGWPWRAARAGIILPRALRDFLYQWVARNRYRWFGRRESCWVPTPDVADRIL
jgi:predicted DCC family thiol-disulfide oxidoreductase YuxK